MDINENAERALRMVRESHDLVYDTESSGLDWKINSPVGYVIGAPQGDGIDLGSVVYVPIRHGGGGNMLGGRPMTKPDDDIEIHPWEVELAKAFDYRNARANMGRVVGHHTKFDCHFSANTGVMLGRRMACTQNQAAIIDEYARSYSLDACATRHGVTAKLGQTMYDHLGKLFSVPPVKDSMGHFWRTSGNDPIAVDYACRDVVTTWELYVKQRQLIDEEETRVIADLENDLIWTVFRMERKGIKIDMTRIGNLQRKTEAEINDALSSFPTGFNVRSPLMMRKAMEDAGHKDWPKTEKGNPSFTESWLKKNPLGRQVIKIRQMTNLLNSFIGPLQEKHIHNGRVHATLNQLKSDDTGTISGRFSCSSPNLQQVPKRNKELARPFRSLFVADEGYVFWERDYSQCEPRLFAHYSQDTNLLRGYNSVPFVDAHQTVADLLGVERDPTAKRMNMGIFTGMQPRTFAGHMGYSVPEATEAWNKWFQAFPGVRQFQNNAKARLGNRGFVFTLLGRRCRLEARQYAYRGTSKIIQGGNADIMKYKLLEVDRMCEDNGDIVQVLMTVHDSFNGQFQDTPEARALMTRIEEVMIDIQRAPFNLSVPFVVEGEEGPDWNIATFGSEK